MPDPTGAFCVIVGALALGALLGNLHAPHDPRHCLRCLRARQPFGLVALGALLVLPALFYWYGFKQRLEGVRRD